MDRNCVGYTNPSSGQQDRPVRKRKRGKDWETLKSDIYRVYIEEEKDLKTTKAMISLIPGFESFDACDRTWKDQLDAWDFVKKIKHEDMEYMIAKEKQRASGGKRTEFERYKRRVEPHKLEKAKKRGNVREVSPSFPTPHHITYHTPRSINENDPPEEICENTMISNSSRSMDENKCSEKLSEGARPFQFLDPTNLDNEEGFSEALSEEFFTCAPPLSPSSFLSCFVSENSTTVSDFGTEDIGIQTTGIIAVPFISSIHRYLSEKDMPWNAQFLMHQLGAHDTMLARQRQMLSEITDNLGLSQDDIPQPLDHYEPQCSLPETSYIGTRFPSETSSGVVDETEDRTSKSLRLEELFDLTEKLVNCQTIHGEFDPQTLELEFKLGKSCHRNGNLEEAEYHCRRILRKHPQIDVQSFLGLVLSDASRTDEAMYLLFCALTGFISESAESSMRTNSLRFHPIQLLYLEVIPRSWASMNRVMFELMTTMEEAGSESTVDQFCQVLYIHGYSIAHECFLLGMVSSAKYMYQNILHPGRNLNSWLHGIEEAKARQIFGLVLKDEKRWEESVNQVLLACESALNSGVHDNQFIELLQSDFMELMPLLPPTAFELTTGDPLQAKHKILLDILQNKSPALQYAAPNLSQHAGIGESVPEIPQNLATTQPLRPSICNAPFESTELPLRELNQGRGSASRASTSGFSTAPSYKIGVSYTDSSGCTGVSISGFLGL